MLIGLASCFNYFQFRQSYWLAELPPFVFCALVTVFAISIIFLSKEKIISFTPIDIAVAIFFVYSFVSTYSIAAPYPPSDRIFNLWACLIFYSGIRMSGALQNRSYMVFYGILCFVLLQAVWGIAQYLQWLPVASAVFKVQGGFINPGIYGCFMAMGFVLAIALIGCYNGSKFRLLLWYIAALILFSALLLSLSRTALVAALAGMMIVLFFRFQKQFAAVFRRHKFLLLSGLLLIITIFFYFLWQRNTVSVSGRFLIWKISTRLFTANPIFGIGYGNFFTEYGNEQADYFLSGNRSPEEINMADMTYYPFNELLRIIVENGIIGLVLFLSIIILLFNAIKNTFRLKDSAGVIFTALITTLLVFALFSYPFQDATLSLLLFLCVAFFSSKQNVKFNVQKPMHFYKPVALLLLCFMLFRSLQKINAIISWRDAKEMLLMQEGASLKKYEAIATVLSNNGAFLFNYGAELSQLSIYEISISLLTRAARYGNSVELQSRLAEAYEAIQQPKKAELYYKKAANIVPKLFVPLDDLLQFYIRTHQTQKVKTVVAQICSKPVKIPSVQIDAIKKKACGF